MNDKVKSPFAIKTPEEREAMESTKSEEVKETEQQSQQEEAEIDPADAALEPQPQRDEQQQAEFETTQQAAELNTTQLEGKFYSCLPMKTYSVGRFHFTNGQMSLHDAEDIADFESLINAKNFPEIDRNRIKTVDLGLAEQIASSRAAATRGFDSGQNKDFEQLKAQNPKVGTGNMGTKDSGQKA